MGGVDCGWRTDLGTCIYGRVDEARSLASVFGEIYSTIVFVGPRNVGKSELARYMVRGVLGLRPVEIDARVLRAREFIQLPRDLVLEAIRVVEDREGVGGLLEVALKAVRSVGFDRVVVLDEFHLASREPIKDLEALAKLVAFYPRYSGWRLVFTTSDGWVMSQDLESAVEGYRALIHVVEPLNETDMGALYREYAEKNTCRVDWSLVWGLAGGLPGYIPFLCSMGVDALESWIGRLIDTLERFIVSLREEYSGAIDTMHRILVEGSRPSNRLELELGIEMVKANLAYYSRQRFHPQLKAYAHIIEIWRRRGKKPSPREVIGHI